MNSRFYYPTNDGSLGEPRRARNFPSMGKERLFSFAPDRNLAEVSERPTVLVAETDDESLYFLKDILANKGYRVLQAYDGNQTLAIAEAEKLDLILLAHQPSLLSGLGVLRHMREDMNLESLPIVIMLGWDPERHREPAIAAGCDDFLLKPVDSNRLDALLDYFVPLQTAS
jgi:CheY-like chemotaxis protein